MGSPKPTADVGSSAEVDAPQPENSRERRDLARLGRGAFIAQMVSSASNLLAGVAVARLLGASALGTFSLLFSALLAIVSLQSSWVGDSLVVLGRHLPWVRGGA